MKSKIFFSEKLENKNRHFGSALTYYPAMIDNGFGEEHPALFTIDQIKKAMNRANLNPEDVPEEKSFWEILTGK